MTDAEREKPRQDDNHTVAALRDQVQFLRIQLHARGDDVRRLHVLLRQEQQKTKIINNQGVSPKYQAKNQKEPEKNLKYKLTIFYNSTSIIEDVMINLFGINIFTMVA